jgi:hypothetical protein
MGASSVERVSNPGRSSHVRSDIGPRFSTNRLGAAMNAAVAAPAVAH